VGQAADSERDRSRAEHPTKTKITQAAVGLLETRDVTDLTVDEVLAVAGVTKGAMYHHFDDYAEVLETAMVARFSAGVDWSIAMLELAFEAPVRDADFLAQISRITRLTHAPERAPVRLERARTLALAQHHPRLRRALAVEQQRLTDTFTELFVRAQSRGLINPHVDPHAAAVFIQAFTLGRVVDDISERPVDPEAWFHIIDSTVERAFGV
jgi:AcrR family transcriptional regulator